MPVIKELEDRQLVKPRPWSINISNRITEILREGEEEEEEEELVVRLVTLKKLNRVEVLEPTHPAAHQT